MKTEKLAIGAVAASANCHGLGPWGRDPVSWTLIGWIMR